MRPNFGKNRWGLNINRESPTFSNAHNVARREWRRFKLAPTTSFPWHSQFDQINASFSAMAQLSAFFRRHESRHGRVEQLNRVAVSGQTTGKANAATRLLLCARTPRLLPVRPPWMCCSCRWPRASSGYKAGSQGTLAHARTSPQERATGRGHAHAPRTREEKRPTKRRKLQ